MKEAEVGFFCPWHTTIPEQIELLYKAQLPGIFIGMDKLLKIGLTGGIASGKSLVAKMFSARGVLVIDMDKLSRDLLENDPTLQNEVINLMGSNIMTQGKIDRLKLRKLIFSDPSKKTSLEGLIHPRVRKQFEQMAQQEAQKGKRLVICEAALLIEGGYFRSLDRLIVVLAPENLRKQRLFDRDKISPELVDKMIQAQVTDEERLKRATHIIYNDSTLEHLEKQVQDLISSWKKENLI